MAFRKSKKEPMTDSSSNLNLNLYEPVSIINYEKRKCNRFLQKTGALCGTRPAGVRVQRVQKVQRVQRVVVDACGASFDKT